MRQVSMKSLANHILAVASKHDLFVTNLQLQKVMYFSFIHAIKMPLVFNRNSLKHIYDYSDQHFLVWRYGPVIKIIYELFSIYSANPIISNGKESKFFNDGFFNNYIIKLIHENPFRLVNQSHANNFWSKNEKNIIGYRSRVRYPFSVLEESKDYVF